MNGAGWSGCGSEAVYRDAIKRSRAAALREELQELRASLELADRWHQLDEVLRVEYLRGLASAAGVDDELTDEAAAAVDQAVRGIKERLG